MSWSPIGRPVRVGLFEHSPDAYSCFRMLPQKPCPKPGSEVEIVQIVMKMLDWEWEVVDTNEAFGVINDFGNPKEDGNYSGIMGLLADNKIDMSGLSLRITPDRMTRAHFTFPIRYFQQVYIIKRPPDNDFRNFIFASFTTEILSIVNEFETNSTTYSCNSISAPEPSPWLDTSDLLAARKTHLTYYYNMTLEGSSEKNVRRMNRILQYNPIIVHPKESDLMDEIKRGNVFYSTYDIEFLPYPGLTVIRDTTGIISYVAFGFSSNNKKLCHLFNEALLKILPGIPQITRAPGYAFVKAPEDTTIQVKKTRLSLNGHLEQLFYIYIIGVGICIVVFFTEIIVHRLVKLKNRQVSL
ncbi:hypothetical protein WR25_11671 isoform B [Diploscapter pachys]|uniref:Ionotropic glutamate receptor L-glutamate and glycine-binding domain-containing protein n=1 Tax=Diploscapter pachys TaxID=2018661 RepID=A0A2A2LAH5_9BILA|nr:hypothetical protein WR25_11671 isoform B [Diploscapter pachys]